VSDRLRLLVSVLFIFAASAIAGSAQYGYQVWTVDNGLPQNGVRGITQTQDGYLWIATMGGLVRFDGLRFTIFNKSNSLGITSSRFTGLEQAKNGDLWAVYESGGILRYHEGRFRTYDLKDGIPGANVSTVTADDKGNVWILSSGKIAQWNPQTDRFELSRSLNQRIYGPLVWENKGFVAYDKTNVYCFSAGRLEVYRLPEGLRGKIVLRVGLDQNWIAWLTLSSGELIRLAPGDPSQVHQLPRESGVPYRGRNGESWQFHATSEFMRSINATSAGKPLDINFRYAYADNQGNLWLATEDGLYRLQNQVIRTYSIANGLPDRDIFPIYQDNAGSIWLGVWHKGLSRFSKGKFENFTVADGLPYPLVSSISQTGDGLLWVATHGGLAAFQHGHISKLSLSGMPDGVIQAIFQDKTGTVWFGSRTGASRLKGKSVQPFPVAGKVAPIDVHVIAETPDGDLWFGGVNGLTQLHGETVTNWSEADGLGSNNVWSLYADADGTLWIGTPDGGLARLKDRKITRYTTENGLFNDGVFQILDDGLGNLWMSCDLGIYRVNKAELNEFADHKRKSISSIPFGKADGLLTLQSNGGVSPSGAKMADGQLWFPTQDGAAVVDPRKVRIDSRTPRVTVEAISIDQVSTPIEKAVTIPPSRYTLQIQYTAPDFVRPDQLRFRYKLEGLDQDWTEAGSHRSASYTHLPPGDYRFVVSVRDETGIWSPPSKPIFIYVQAPFYKTRWFEIILLSVISLIAVGVWRYRLIELKAKHALQVNFLQQLMTSQEEERKRIARDLHDSLGQRLVVINSTAKLALRFRDHPARSIESIFEEISTEATAGLEDTRSIAYDLRPSHLDRLGLTLSIEYLVQKVSAASGISIAAHLDNIDDLVPSDQWINLYRIVQEAVGNVVKYSSASKSNVNIDRSGDTAVLTIQDDGVGFEVDGNLGKASRGGMGLRGMAERASLIGGDFRLQSTLGHGTVITIKLRAAPSPGD